MNMAFVKPLVGAAIGAAVGFAMYKVVGCRGGACPLTGNPWLSMIVWGAVGAMLSMSGR